MTHATPLLPCPFCGGEATLNYDTIWQSWDITCNKDCILTFETFDSKEVAISKWNRRTPTPALSIPFAQDAEATEHPASCITVSVGDGKWTVVKVNSPDGNVTLAGSQSKHP